MSVRASYTGNRKWLRQGEDGESSCKSPWENLSLSLSLSVTAVWQLSLTHALLWSSKYLETYLHFFNRIWISRIRIYIHRPCWFICSAMAFLVCMRGVLSFMGCDRGGWVFSNGSERWSDIRHNTWRAKGAQLRKASSLKEKLQLKMDILPLFCNLDWSFDKKIVYFFLHKFSNWCVPMFELKHWTLSCKIHWFPFSQVNYLLKWKSEPKGAKRWGSYQMLCKIRLISQTWNHFIDFTLAE